MASEARSVQMDDEVLFERGGARELLPVTSDSDDSSEDPAVRRRLRIKQASGALCLAALVGGCAFYAHGGKEGGRSRADQEVRDLVTAQTPQAGNFSFGQQIAAAAAAAEDVATAAPDVHTRTSRIPPHAAPNPNTVNPETGIRGDAMLGMMGPGDGEIRAQSLLPQEGGCEDKNNMCTTWAIDGKCQTDPSMHQTCKKACNFCSERADGSKAAVWQAIRGSVADVEGEDAGMMATSNVGACEKRCDESGNCNSFTYCLDGKCYFKTKNLTGHESFHKNKWCSSHFKSNEYLPADSALLAPSAAQPYTFYMYRAQTGPDFYPLGNVNTGNMAGVLWYLHNEVIVTCEGKGFLSSGIIGDRKFAVDRIRRVKVTVKPTTPLVAKGINFGALQSFDSGETTGPHRATKDCGPGTGFGSTPEWDEYGFHVGCGKIGDWPHQEWKSGKSYPNTVWYSLPGPCPQMTYKRQTEQCQTAFPGGLCSKATGQGNCTFQYEEAGYIMIDHLVGIQPKWKNRMEFCQKCKTEGGPTWRGGCGLDFWGETIYNKEDNEKRVQLALDEFHKKYPNMPKEEDLPAPACDFDKAKYGFPEDWQTWGHSGYH
eukprot:TRINITY_DN5709_c0_g1_i1.p1 TRINITY_DN5709_c0_g1~~TRINITY_DN5709_c0_g1_i1.p1  ORF type:complete len:626 (+),score=113.04 TRINITY_DN5709_c0_g1_i1:86-1879(+)